ncbi:MAG: 16S rRNA (guanine(527)-N(7))-methyltransferase RsmG [Sphingobacteriales bacterium]|nr:16S rRNA (guanine(527)-N(7))-methyltransferase RsmG [Sphingobacteriales bacterium]
MDKILHFFPQLNSAQIARFEALLPLYKEWNEKINVISRNDIDNLYLKHVLHSLAIAKKFQLAAGMQVLDIGTGGGFPGIPLAIYFPQVRFTLADSIAKKIRVTGAVAQALELDNVQAVATRVEQLPKQQYDCITSRAVAPLAQLYAWSRHSLRHCPQSPNGWICLKGGDLSAEIAALPPSVYLQQYPLRQLFAGEPFFEEKQVVYFRA